MALNAKMVQKAWEILHAVNPDADRSSIQEYQEGFPMREDAIIGIDRKSDGGWENIFMNVKHITSHQLTLFNERKGEIYNTSFIRDFISEGITRIGWF